MNWFKNLNATPRLITCFGVMIALTLGMAATELNVARRVAEIKTSNAVADREPSPSKGRPELSARLVVPHKSSRRAPTSVTRLPVTTLATIGACNDASLEDF